LAEARDIRRRVVWPLLVLLLAGVMILSNRSPTGTVAATDQEIEQWVRDWAQPHIDDATQPLPTANSVLDRSLSRRLLDLGGAEPEQLVVTVLPLAASSAADVESRHVRIERGADAFVVITVHQLRDGTLVVSGVLTEEALDDGDALGSSDARGAAGTPGTPHTPAP